MPSAVDERVEEAPHCRRLPELPSRCRCRALIERARRIAQRDHVALGEALLDHDAARGRGAELDRRSASKPGRRSACRRRSCRPSSNTAWRGTDERVLLIEHERRAHALARLHHVVIGRRRARSTTPKYWTGEPWLARLRELVDEPDLAVERAGRAAPRSTTSAGCSSASPLPSTSSTKTSASIASSSGISATLLARPQRVAELRQLAAPVALRARRCRRAAR